MNKVLIIDNNTVHRKKLEVLLPCPFDVIEWTQVTLEKTKDYDVIILTGGTNVPHIMDYEEAFAQEIEIIRSSGKAIIGICLGCELIARAFGATLTFLGEKRQGTIEIITTDQSGILFENNRCLSVYEGHSWAIKNLPQDVLETLAQSADGPEIIKHKTLPLWGFQFHPEHLTEETLGDEIFLKVLNHCLY